MKNKKSEFEVEDEMIFVNSEGVHIETFFMDSPQQAQRLLKYIRLSLSKSPRRTQTTSQTKPNKP